MTLRPAVTVSARLRQESTRCRIRASPLPSNAPSAGCRTYFACQADFTESGEGGATGFVTKRDETIASSTSKSAAGSDLYAAHRS